MKVGRCKSSLEETLYYRKAWSYDYYEKTGDGVVIFEERSEHVVIFDPALEEGKERCQGKVEVLKD